MKAPTIPASFTWSAAHASAKAVSPATDPLGLLLGALILSDAIVALLSSFSAYGFREGSMQLPPELLLFTLLAVLLNAQALHLSGVYSRTVTAFGLREFRRVVRGWSGAFLGLLVMAYATKTSGHFSRVWAIMWYASALGGFALTRLGASVLVRAMRSRGRLGRTVAIVDLSGHGVALARRLIQHAGDEIRLVGVFTAERCGGRRNSVDDLVALARLFRIDEVLVALSSEPLEATAPILRMIGTIPTNVRLCPELPPLRVAPREAAILFGQPMLTVYSKPLAGWDRVAKRLEDLLLASVVAMLASPLLIAVALAIKLDSRGPVLFKQKRLGFNNNVFVVYKFRTMIHRPDPENDVPQAVRDDPRMTGLGRFLRRSSLDELPQLVNVLRGEMSLVGPRPHALPHNDRYARQIDDYLGRHRVQPGITGWAQVNGLRGETDTLEKMQRRVDHDLAYIDQWSFTLDLRILALTAFRCTFDRNAF